MANSSATLDKWREYFRGSNSDIFNIIEHAIMVAASDCPYDFKLKRDRIAEVLFTCKQTKCFGCERIELAAPCENDAEKSDEKYKSESKDTKESKVNSSRDVDHAEMNANHVSNSCFGEAEALTDVLEEEYQLLGEILRIREILDNSEEEYDSFLFESLRRLQLMPLSVEILKATEIGKSVNVLRKHGSKEIRNIVKTLIGDWKIMVDEWANAKEAIAGPEVATESVKTSAFEEEEGLPSPPMDEGVFFAAPTSMELSQFFDGMDDDDDDDGIGDVLDRRNSGEFNKNRKNGRKPTLEKPSIPKLKDQTPESNKDHGNGRKARLEKPSISKWKDQAPADSRTRLKDTKGEQKKDLEAVVNRQTPVCKPNKLPSSETGPRMPRPTLRNKVKNEIQDQQKPDEGTIQKKPMRPPQRDKLRGNDEALEAAKRKLHERYQEAEKAKKQRTVQVVEFCDLPKQSLPQRNQHMRANGRR